MRNRLILLAALALSSCGGDVRDTKIKDLNLPDMSSTQQVAQQLDPGERKAFNSYVMTRVVGISREVVRPDGSAPETVREAIALTMARDKLSAERNALVERLNTLMPDDGSGLPDSDRPEWDRLKKQIADYDKVLYPPSSKP